MPLPNGNGEMRRTGRVGQGSPAEAAGVNESSAQAREAAKASVDRRRAYMPASLFAGLNRSSLAPAGTGPHVGFICGHETEQEIDQLLLFRLAETSQKQVLRPQCSRQHPLAQFFAFLRATKQPDPPVRITWAAFNQPLRLEQV